MASQRQFSDRERARSALGNSWVQSERSAQLSESVTQADYQKFSIHPSAVKILMQRGIKPEDTEEFLNPTREKSMLKPKGIRRMKKSVNFICEAMQRGDKIAILGDYDVDGCTGTALLERFFLSVGVAKDKLTTYIPHREKEGYGPNKKAIDALHKQGVKLLITVDCGTTSFDSLQYAKTLGMKVIVTDHHKPAKDQAYPEGAEIVNPNRKDSKLSAQEARKYEVLTGAGVAYLLAEALYKRLDKPKKRQDRWFDTHIKPDHHALFDSLTVLAAMGTYCDVAPITGMNRWLLKEGLHIMNQWKDDCTKGVITHWPIVGLQYLVNEAQIKDKRITEDHIGFQLGPRINAAGRMDDAIQAESLLSTDDPQQAHTLARMLNHYNQTRKSTQDEVFDQAKLQAEQQVQSGRSVIVVSGKNWHEGVIGIVAGKLKERFNLPCCVLTINDKGQAKGSARSIEGVDIGDPVLDVVPKRGQSEDSALLRKGGGHAMAAGFSLDASRIAEFHDYLDNVLKADVTKARLHQKLKLDDVLTIADITDDLAMSYQKLGPFGRHHEAPRVAIRDAKIVRASGRETRAIELCDAHHSNQRADAILFNAGILGMYLDRPGIFHLAGHVVADEYRGKPQLKLHIKDAYWGEQLQPLLDAGQAIDTALSRISKTGTSAGARR